jgi:cell division septation protein DedD
MTFYKSVEQKDANADLTPPADAKLETTPGNTTPAQAAPTSADSSTTLPTGGYFVQVAAVSKQEDANSLVDALKQKQYPAFVASSVANDKLFRVQLGPFSEVKEAEGMRARLIADGYSPILKK